MAIEVPPEKMDAVRQALKDKNKLLYIVVGESSSEAWGIALAVEQEMAGVLAVRIKDRKDAADWVGPKDKVSVTTNWAGEVVALLSATEAEDKDFVLGALNRASGNA